MSIIEHLRELRVRLVRAAIALTAGFIVRVLFFRSAIRLAHDADSAGLARQTAPDRHRCRRGVFHQDKSFAGGGTVPRQPGGVLGNLEIYRARALSDRAQDGVPIHYFRDDFLHLGRILLLGRGVQGWLSILSRPVFKHRRDPNHSYQRIPGVLGQADAGFRDHFRNADFRLLPDQARRGRLQNDGEAVPLCHPDHLRDFRRADTARHGVAISPRDSAARPVRHQRRRVVRFPQQDQPAAMAENSVP